MDREAVDRAGKGAFKARAGRGALKRLGFSLTKKPEPGADQRRGLHQVDRALAQEAKAQKANIFDSEAKNSDIKKNI